ncbi:MAG: IS630 family transposase [Thermoplasmata archaeon]
MDRARIVLAAADGKTNDQIAQALRLHARSVGLWRRRFALLRLEGIAKDAPRTGRKPRLDSEVIKAIIVKTLHTKPRGETHWSTRTMAREVGLHHSTIARIWNLHGIRPHRTESFKLSKDPKFEEKLFDVVGLYMNPPERSVIFSIDEKPQTQALERTQAILPMGRDWPEGRPHDYRRHGTTELYAALNILDGEVTTEFHERHRHQEFLAFLRTLDGQVSEGLQVHAVLDNLSAHKTPEVERWLRRHPRFHFHFIPTSSSWVNMVESWLGQLQTKALNRGSFRSVPELKQAILDFVATSNGRARPWVWTKSAPEIMRKIAKLRKRLSAPIIDPLTGAIKALPLATDH